MKISIVIPCYKSENTIEDVVRDIELFFSQAKEYEYETVLVDDHSPDDTLRVLKELPKQYKKLIVLALSRNFGQHAAIMAGLNKANGDIIVCIDDDGQTPPLEMQRLICKINEGYDVVYAKYEDKKHSSFRNLGSKFNDYMAVKLLGKPRGLYMSSYFAAKKYVIDEVIKYKNPYPYLGGLILRITRSIANVKIVHYDRLEGETTYTFRKLIQLWANGFTAFSVTPLRVASITGFVVSLIGLAFALYIIINRFMNPDMALGWSSLMAAVLVMNGVVLMSLGLIGEYIGRVYISANESPQFVIKEEIDSESKN